MTLLTNNQPHNDIRCNASNSTEYQGTRASLALEIATEICQRVWARYETNWHHSFNPRSLLHGCYGLCFPDCGPKTRSSRAVQANHNFLPNTLHHDPVSCLTTEFAADYRSLRRCDLEMHILDYGLSLKCHPPHKLSALTSHARNN